MFLENIINQKRRNIMPVFRITATSTRVFNGQRLDKRLYVDVQTYGYGNPIINEKEKVAYAFFTRGVDLKKMGALNTSCLTAKRIG